MNINNAYPSLDILNQLPGCWGCKDKTSAFVYVNEEFANILGFKNNLDCIGLKDFDMPSPTAKCAYLFRQQDLEVINTGKQLRILNIHPYADGQWRAFLFTKTAWRDVNKNIIGIIFSGIELKETSLLEVGHWLCRTINFDPAHPSTTIDKTNITLNTRESEVLFLLLYGKKPQYIAKMLNLAVKTVENYVIRLREKFNANSKGELIEIALNSGFGSRIPESMLKTQLSIILK